MTPERYRSIGRLFDKALGRAFDERAAFLEQACGADVGLRAEVEKLLANHVSSEDFLSRPAMDVAAALLAQDQAASAVGRQLGHYRILSLLGAGGMGVVYLAEDTRLRREAALKILPQGFAGEFDRLHRFEQEAFAASALNHPNILTIYEFGSEGGMQFIASEVVRARPCARASSAGGRLCPKSSTSPGSSPPRYTPRTRPASSTATSSPRT